MAEYPSFITVSSELLDEVNSWDEDAWTLYAVIASKSRSTAVYLGGAIFSPHYTSAHRRYLQLVLSTQPDYTVGPVVHHEVMCAIQAVIQARKHLDDLTPEARETALALAPSWHGCLEMLLLAATALTKENN